MNAKHFIPVTSVTRSKVSDPHYKKTLRGYAVTKSCYKQPGHRNGKQSSN